MPEYPKEIFDAALRLPAKARAALAEDLLDTLDPDEGVEEAWREEIATRLARMERGEGKTFSLEEVQAQMARRLKSQ